MESLAGALRTTVADAARLFGQLEQNGLIERAQGRYGLTQAGLEYARRILRAHRLVEVQLASASGMSEADWHREAEKREHELSAQHIERLARELGDPRFDPHGDPIPTASGAWQPASGTLLLDCAVGFTGRIVHVEDEPADIYKELVKEGMVPGLRLRVTHSGSDGCRLLVEGRSTFLSRAAAANVLVDSLAEGDIFDEQLRRLDGLSLGERAEIAGLLPTCRGLERRRLVDLGFVPGTPISVDLQSPYGDPTAYLVRGASIALRREQAERVLIRAP